MSQGGAGAKELRVPRLARRGALPPSLSLGAASTTYHLHGAGKAQRHARWIEGLTALDHLPLARRETRSTYSTGQSLSSVATNRHGKQDPLRIPETSKISTAPES